jgi:hypothetical protein
MLAITGINRWLGKHLVDRLSHLQVQIEAGILHQVDVSLLRLSSQVIPREHVCD